MNYEIPTELYQKLNPLLSEPLDYQNIDNLKRQLAELQSLRYELSHTRTSLYGKLLRERERVRIPKDKEFTELDRKTMLGASTSIMESDYEFMVSLEQIVTDSINLGVTFLN